MSRLSAEAGKVNEERTWLVQTTSVPGISMVEELLFNRSPHDEVSRHREFILDVSGLSTLACEHYVNGFTIAVVSFKFLERTKDAGTFIFPPSVNCGQSKGWSSSSTRSIHAFPQVADTMCVLTPVHFERPQHWELSVLMCAAKLFSLTMV